MSLTRGRWIFLVLLGGGIAAAATLGYKNWPRLIQKIRKPPSAVNVATDQTSTIPPFSTKEPERYQAIRIITDQTNGQTTSSIEKTIIARDGSNRREEVSRDSAPVTVYLENSAGRFLLLPASKYYLDLNTAAGGVVVGGDEKDTNVDFSPDRLLHESSDVSRHQNLGPDVSNGRKTTKYLVTSPGREGGTTSNNQTIIWVDDELGMPIRSESRSDDGSISLMELQVIRLQVDPRLFELPSDFTKVDLTMLQTEITRLQSNSGNGSAKPRTP